MYTKRTYFFCLRHIGIPAEDLQNHSVHLTVCAHEATHTLNLIKCNNGDFLKEMSIHVNFHLHQTIDTLYQYLHISSHTMFSIFYWTFIRVKNILNKIWKRPFSLSLSSFWNKSQQMSQTVILCICYYSLCHKTH